MAVVLVVVVVTTDMDTITMITVCVQKQTSLFSCLNFCSFCCFLFQNRTHKLSSS